MALRGAAVANNFKGSGTGALLFAGGGAPDGSLAVGLLASLELVRPEGSISG